MPLFYNHKLVFIHIPKTGGMSVEEHFRKLDDPPRFYGGRFVNNHSPQHSCFYELNTWELVPKDWKVFTIVRNPYDRFLSEYNYLKGKASMEMLLNADETTQYDNHLLPMYRFTEGCENITILRYESLSKDFKRNFGVTLEERVNISPKIVTKLPQNIKKEVRKKYDRDFKLFNYE